MSWTSWERALPELKEVIYEKKYREEGGGVARVSVNRPERYNSWTGLTIEEIGIALDDASHDQTIGVAVFTGVGEHFGTGGDVKYEAGGGLRQIFYYRLPTNHYLRTCRKPVIAAVKGYCIGGSHHFAYMCDFTIAAENAKFGQTGPKVGSPADGYFVAYLNRVVGAKKAREIWMLCRRYDAKQALEMGLVNTVVPLEKLEEEVDKWCEEILALSPTCLEIVKATFDSDIDYLSGSFGQMSRLIAPDWFEGPEIQEAQQAFLEKRKPNFWKFRQYEMAKQKLERRKIPRWHMKPLFMTKQETT